MAQDFDPVEVGVQAFSSISGCISSAAMLYGAYMVPPPAQFKAMGAAAIGVMVLCLVCCLSITYGAERAANQLPGQD